MLSSGHNLNIPEGTRDIIAGEASVRADLVRRFSEVYERGGFIPVTTPALEYYDVFDCDKSIRQESMYKLTDTNGRLIVLRADNTTPMVRVAATKLRGDSDGGLNLRKLCYNQSIYRIGTVHSGRRSEIYQSGVELIGAAGIKSDLVCVTTAIAALDTLGIDFKIELGHVGFYNALISELDLESADTESIRRDVERKNLARISEFGKIAAVPRLYGGSEVFAQARETAGENQAALDALSYLRSLFDILYDAGYGDRVIVDMGIVHDIDYYTGVVFRGFLDGAGEPVLTGGRYDRLTASFGDNSPATGFALNIGLAADTVIKRYGMPECRRADILLFFPAQRFAEAEKVKLGYERQGLKCEYSLCDDVKDAHAYAQAHGIERVVEL